jgi:hypothetical protein
MAWKKNEKRDYKNGADAYIMSDEDYALSQKNGEGFNKAKAEGNQAGMDYFHAQEEALRAKYGYSGGPDGSQYIPQKTTKSYGEAPSYTSAYQDQIDQVLSGILDRPAFSYDYTQDPLYQQYKESYTREGQRAMEDTLGQISARTGGLASSYASSAAQQANQYYMQQLNDKVPELQQLAYQMYLDDLNADITRLNLLQGLESSNYGRYQDTLGQWNADRNFQYGLDRDAVADQRYDQEWNYQVGRDELADQRYEDETAWEREQYQSETAYQRALEKAQTLALSGDFSGYAALGYDANQIAALESWYARENAGGAGRISGGQGGGKNSPDYDGLFLATYRQGISPEAYLKNEYRNYGLISSSGLTEAYEQWLSDQANAIDPIIWEDINRLAEGGADASVVAQQIQHHLDAGKINLVQADVIAKSFQF